MVLISEVLGNTCVTSARGNFWNSFIYIYIYIINTIPIISFCHYPIFMQFRSIVFTTDGSQIVSLIMDTFFIYIIECFMVSSLSLQLRKISIFHPDHIFLTFKIFFDSTWYEMAYKLPETLLLTFGNRISWNIEKDNCQCPECRALHEIINA